MPKKTTATVAPAEPLPPCYRCPNDATLRRRIKDRWENICPACDRAIRKDEADAYCQKRGITTPEQARNWLKKNPLLVKRAPIRAREPGDDDAEITP